VAGAPRVCRVQPDVPAVARAFDYLVPDELAHFIRVGTIVRVPLHGRRVRGWVVADNVKPEVADARLRPLRTVVSAGPPPDVVALVQWAAWRWAGPVATFLRAASPPTVVEIDPEPEVDDALYPVRALPDVLGGPLDGHVRVVTWPPGEDRRLLITSLLGPEGSTLVVVPEAARAGALVTAIAREGREVLLHHGALADRERTAIWDQVRRGAHVVVGGRAAVWLPFPDLRTVVVVDENDEALQDERAPTWHAREVVLERTRRIGAPVTLVSPAPTVDARATADTAVAPPANRLRAGWPRLDIVDLRSEPPGTGLLSAGLGAVLHRAVDDGGRAICVVNRRGRARLLACRACRELARCATCGATVAQPEHDLVCARCGATRPPVCVHCGATRFRAVRPGVNAVRDEVAALMPRIAVTEVDATTDVVGNAPILVGTEAVLHRVRRGEERPVRLVAFLAFDEEVLAPRYRAAEQALWLLVRAARLLGGRRDGGVLLVQTRVPDHDVLGAATSGDPVPFTTVEAAVREATEFPPFGGLAELAGAVPAVAEAADAIRAVGLTVLGGTDGRALVRAVDATALADGLAEVDFTAARARGRLRLSVDPPRV
jgi:primosomal protein N' (replication factor Y)